MNIDDCKERGQSQQYLFGRYGNERGYFGRRNLYIVCKGGLSMTVEIRALCEKIDNLLYEYEDYKERDDTTTNGFIDYADSMSDLLDEIRCTLV